MLPVLLILSPPGFAPADPKVADNCLFLHGLGVTAKHEEAFFMGVAYWLDLKKVAATLCNHTHYPVFDTVTRGAANTSLQDDFFNEATKYQGPNDRVFAHSMGNVILSRACLDQGKCLEKGWFAAHGPFTGSYAPNLLADWCPPSGSGFPQRMQGYLGKLVGYCSPATYSLQTCDRTTQRGGTQCVCGGEAELAKVGAMTRHGVMCGTSGFGITSVVSPALAALDDFYAKPRGAAPDDGMVSLSSCTPAFDAWVKSAGRHDEFQPVPTSRYYRAETNHADGMGFSGDGLVGDARKPVTWYTQMITRGWLD